MARTRQEGGSPGTRSGKASPRDPDHQQAREGVRDLEQLKVAALERLAPLERYVARGGQLCATTPTRTDPAAEFGEL